MKVLESNRLLLRPYLEDDFAAVHAYASIAENVRYALAAVNDEARTKRFIADAIASSLMDPCCSFLYAITLKENSRLIGGIGLDVKGSEAEVGWILHRDYWSRGYMTEAAARVITFAFSELGLHRIIACCDTMNRPSWHVMEKLGMRREGLFIEGRHGDLLSGKMYADEFSYAILDFEWESTRT